MNNPYHPHNGILIHDRADYDIEQLSDQQFSVLESSDEEGLMLESVTLDEIETAYLFEHRADHDHTAMFEAVSTTKQRLAQTMRAFVRVLNRGLNGTGITAGTIDAGTDESGGVTVGGAQVGNVRRVSGIPVITAKIPFTDGQSVSLIFHSPTSDGIKLVASDALVTFKFLLNKRDVTHAVSPLGGRDISLDQTAQKLSNLIEKNSAKFKKSQSKQAALKSDMERTEVDADKLEAQAIEELKKAEDSAAAHRKFSCQRDDANAALLKLQRANADLEKKISALNEENAAKKAASESQAAAKEEEKPTAAEPNDDAEQPAEPEQPTEPETEADAAAQLGIEYLTGLLSFKSSDPSIIDAELAKVEGIAATLAGAGKMDENEELLNQVADHLVGLSVSVAKGGTP